MLRNHDIPVALSTDTSVWWSGDLFPAMHSTIGADRSREHLEAHAKGDTVTNCHLRVEEVVELGPEEWEKGMNPDIPETKILDNPYTYTDFRSAETHRG